MPEIDPAADLLGLSDVEIMDRADTLHDTIAVMLADIPLEVRRVVMTMLHDDLADAEAEEDFADAQEALHRAA